MSEPDRIPAADLPSGAVRGSGRLARLRARRAVREGDDVVLD